MKALRFDRIGSLDALQVVETSAPVLHKGEVLVEVRAAGLNPSDVKNVLGRFPYTTLPRIPGRDFAGIIVEGPQEVLGLEVWGTGKEPGFTRDGSHARFLSVPLDGIAKKPRTLSFAQAACCGVPYTTAWDALERAGVGAGTNILVLGVGAVGAAALGLAGVRGAHVVAAVRREEQLATLVAEGVQTLLLREPGTLSDSVFEIFPQGADVIFDTTGFLLAESVGVLAQFGRIAVIAAPADGHVHLPVLNLYRRGGSVVGVNSLLYGMAECARMLDRIASYFDSGALPAPSGFREYPLGSALEAYRDVDRGGAGKVVLVP